MLDDGVSLVVDILAPVAGPVVLDADVILAQEADRAPRGWRDLRRRSCT